MNDIASTPPDQALASSDYTVPVDSGKDFSQGDQTTETQV